MEARPACSLWHSIQETFGMHQFRIQQRRSCSAANEIVPEQHEFMSQHGTLAHASNLNSHSAKMLDVEAWLRPIRRFEMHHRTLWSTRQCQFLRPAHKFFEASNDVFARGSFLQLDRDSFRVPIHYRHTRSLRADLHVRWREFFSVESPQYFLSFVLDFFLFAGDEGNHVSHCIERRHSWIPRARERLHSRDDHLLRVELT